MSSENDPGMKTVKAFKRRSIFKTVLAVIGVLVLLSGIALAGTALLFKDAWSDLKSWSNAQLDTGRVRIFRHLSKKFVGKSDLTDADKEDWNGILDRMSDRMLDGSGDTGQRGRLREFFDGIAEAMKDDELRSSELDPIRGDLVNLLAEMDGQGKVEG